MYPIIPYICLFTVSYAKIIDKINFSRYPIDNDYQSHFYVDAIHNVEVDQENLVAKFERIRQSLNDVTAFLYH